MIKWRRKRRVFKLIAKCHHCSTNVSDMLPCIGEAEPRMETTVNHESEKALIDELNFEGARALALLILCGSAGNVRHMQQQRGALGFFQRRSKSGDQRSGQVANETYNV
jgi:hypothetical protein